MAEDTQTVPNEQAIVPQESGDPEFPFITQNGKKYRKIEYPDKSGTLVPAREYESGIITREPNGILYNPNGVPKGDSAEGRRRWRMAIENHNRRVQEAILEATQEKYPGVDIHDTPSAIKRAVKSFWSGIVLNEEKYDRDRLQAYSKIMEDAGLAMSDTVMAKMLDADDKHEAVDDAAKVLAQLNDLIRQIKGEPPDVVEGTVSDVSPE